jgi:hypothetical protein
VKDFTLEGFFKMLQASSVICAKKLATAEKVRTIDFARSGIVGTGNLSPRARRTLAVYIVLVKMGYSGVSAPMGAIADAVYRSSHGESGSIRTLQRAHRELERRGYIRCAVYRPGQRARGTVVSFCPEAFSFWTKIPAKNVTPLPTQSHISPDATTCHPSDRTRDNVSSNSLDLVESIDTKPRAGARAVKKSYRRKNPVLFSVIMVLSKMEMHRTERRTARARAEIESKACTAGVELINPSGVDWAYWEKRWSEFSIPVRETVAAREIIPCLLGVKQLSSAGGEQLSSAGGEQLSSAGGEQLASAGGEQLSSAGGEQRSSAPTTEEIRRVLADLESKFSMPREKAPALESGIENYLEVDETDPEMKILLQARARARARTVNGW